MKNNAKSSTTDWLKQLIGIDSPSGFTENAVQFIEQSLHDIGYTTQRTGKGAIRCALGADPLLGLAAHTDTLGAIVTKILPDGNLAFSPIGGPLLATFEGSYVRIHTMSAGVVDGTMLLRNPSVHANGKASSTERTIDSMYIRLDARVNTPDDTKALGIRVGDIIAFDTKFTALPNGYIKSHFLDNKAGCVVLYDVALRCASAGIAPPVELFFSTYEEVGHGGATGYAASLDELLVIDMGVVGDAVGGHEHLCSICAKDSGGPYDYGMRTTLVQMAEQQSIPHSIDVYPFYSSDGTAAWRAGVDVRAALIGPGVHASHGMERTHIDGITATVDLCMAYIKHRFGTS